MPQPPPAAAAAPAAAATPAGGEAAAASIAAAARCVPLGALGDSSYLEAEGDAHVRAAVDGGDGGDEEAGEEGAADIGFRRAGGGVTWHSG